MQSSESIGNLAKALVAAQMELQHAIKDSTNPAFRSKYADLTSVIDAVRPIFNKHNIAIIQSIEGCDKPEHIAVSTTLLHESGEHLRSVMLVPVPQGKGAQGYGMAGTYGRRYGAAAMCFLGVEDDDGNEISGVAAKGSVPKQQTNQAPTDAPAGDTPKRGPGRPKKASPEATPEGLAELKTKFEAVQTKDDLLKLTSAFTQLSPAQQQELMPIATAARQRAGL